MLVFSVGMDFDPILIIQVIGKKTKSFVNIRCYDGMQQPRPIFHNAEYGLEGMVSTRGDVYSFGIVVMETFTRRKPIDEMFVGVMNLNLSNVVAALEYLHHGIAIPIVHCDLKPNNILLDDAMVAHVADFGIAKLLGGGDSMTRTMTLATVGYMAPEYGMEGIVSTRGDVYSFGIVVMETFTKMKPTYEMFVGEMNLKQWVSNSLLPDAIVEGFPRRCVCNCKCPENRVCNRK
ncbi:hypothetical protein CerSpe_142230 [Prunus speciosa]